MFTCIIMVCTAFKAFGQPSLDLKIVNVAKKGGKIVVEIYNNKKSWLETPYHKIVVTTAQDFKDVSFKIPYGSYAISVYQDINNNGRLDMGIFGIPKEPIGFGNNYKPFGKPKYESAVVDFKETSKLKEIKLFTVF